MSHHDRPELGKFEGNHSRRLAQTLYAVSMEACDDTLGDGEGFGWYGIVRRKPQGIGYILHEGETGFFTYDRMPLAEAEVAWAAIEREYLYWDSLAEGEE